jgi:alkanesulfonate monooxygenase SsuD/methylene tetrahydromethanopterin reductase-like flavin-dependent oxidoreductase (luciferase family)
MILDVFSELQPARPAPEVDARALFEQALEQAELADRAGFGCWWAVEHHTAPEFSLSSAPELVLTAIAGRTRRIRLGTSGILSPFRINHPVRVAERAAWVDVASNGRLELGLARSGGAEWETLLCLMHFGGLPHEAALRSIRLAGEQLLPELHAEPQRRRPVG